MKEKNSFTKAFLDTLKHPVRLLPTIIISIFWLIVSLLSAFRLQIPGLKVLATLTYANAGLYGGVPGAIGGIFGKAFVATFVNMVVVSAVQGQNPFGHMFGGIRKAFGKSALNGAQAGAAVVCGVGSGMLLYTLFNFTATPTNCAVAVVGALAALRAAGAAKGIIFSLLFLLANKLTGGRAPSRVMVSRLLTGMSIGFAITLPMTLIRPWRILFMFLIGGIFFLIGLIVLLLGSTMTKRVVAAVFAAALFSTALLPGYAVTVYAEEDEDDDYVDEETQQVLDDMYEDMTGERWDADKHVYYNVKTGIVTRDFSGGKYPPGTNIYTGARPGGSGSDSDSDGGSGGGGGSSSNSNTDADEPNASENNNNDTDAAPPVTTTQPSSDDGSNQNDNSNQNTQPAESAPQESTPQESTPQESTPADTGSSSGGSQSGDAGSSSGGSQSSSSNDSVGESDADDSQQPEDDVEMIDISEAGGNPYEDDNYYDENGNVVEDLSYFFQDEEEKGSTGGVNKDEADMPESEGTAAALATGVAVAETAGGVAASAAGAAAAAAAGETAAEAGANALTGALAETQKYILPDKWDIGDEGDISFTDPATGEQMTYYNTGETDENGNPVWRSGESYSPYNLEDIYSNYISREENAEELAKDYKIAQENRKALHDEFESGEKSWLTKELEAEKHAEEEEDRRLEAWQEQKARMMNKRNVTNEKDFKKAVTKERLDEYKKQQNYVAAENLADMGYQGAQTVRNTATIVIETAADYEPGPYGPLKGLRDAYAAGRNTAENIGHVMAGSKTGKEALADSVIDSGADFAKYHVSDAAEYTGLKSHSGKIKVAAYTGIDGYRAKLKGMARGLSEKEIDKQVAEASKKGAAEALIENGCDLATGGGGTSTLCSGLLKWKFVNPNED